MTVRVPVEPALLRWACDRRGVRPQDLATRLPGLLRWLDGTSAPTLKQLEDFAAATAAPIGLLFLPEPPVERIPIPDMRTVASARLTFPSPDLLDTLYLCQQRQDWYREYALVTSLRPLGFVGSLALDVAPEEAAGEIRRALAFDRDMAAGWDTAFRVLADSAERLGVLVMQNGIVGVNTHRRLDSDEFRGFALVDPLAPLVFVNGADTKAARMFTLAHELAHIWCGESALSDASPSDATGSRVERWCNAVAAELLVPLDELRQELRAERDPMEEARRLTSRFKVSTLVLIRRLYDAGRISRAELSALYAQEVALFRSRERTDGGGNFYLTQRSRIGRRFTRAVIESTWEGRSSFTEAFRLLGVTSVESMQRLGQAVEAAPS